MSRVAYSATKGQFIQGWQGNVFIEKMVEGAYANRLGDSPSERRSWEANAAKIANLLELARVPDDVYVAFEYKCPLAGRVDCMLFARGRDGKRHIIHIELKQWSNETVSQVYDTGVFKVEAFVGGDYRILAHPSQQALGYQRNIENYGLFVTDRATQATRLVQVAYEMSKPETKAREFAALREARRETGIDDCTIVTRDEEFEEDGIRVVPAWKWFLQQDM